MLNKRWKTIIVAILLVPLLSLTAFAWFNTDFSFRYAIITDMTQPNAISVNDTEGINGHIMWSYIANSSFVYTNSTNFGGDAVIANDTDQKFWENETSRTGNQVHQLWNSTGAVGVWHLGESSGTTSFDSSQGGSNGTHINSPTIINNASCPFGRCLYFNGVDELVNVTDASAVNLQNNTFSIMAWIRPAQTDGQLITGMKLNNTANYIYQIGITDAGENFVFALFDGTSNPMVTSTVNVVAGELYLLVGTYNGTDMELFVNATSEGTTSASTNITTTEPVYVIGRNPGSANRFFNGYIDEVRMYNRILSDTEIQEIYNNGIDNLSTLGEEETEGATIVIDDPEETIYGIENVTINFTVTDDTESTFNVSVFLNGSSIFNNETFANNTRQLVFEPIVEGDYNLTITALNISQELIFHNFYGLNITTQFANGTITNGWNLLADNTTNTFSLSDQNSSRLIEWFELPEGDNNITINFSNKFDSDSQTFNINSSMLFIQPTFNLYRFQQFNIEDEASNPLEASITFGNGTDTVTRTASNGEMEVSLRQLEENIGIGNTTLDIILSGYASQRDIINFNLSAEVNKTYTLDEAGLDLVVRDENTEELLTFNVTISNSTDTDTFTNQTLLELNSTEMPTGDVTLSIIDFDGLYEERDYFVTIDQFSLVNKTAYLLATVDAQEVVFEVRNVQNEPIEGALVTINRTINGSSVIIEQAETDSVGKVTVNLDPDITYTVTFSKDGFTSETINYKPSSPFFETIILGELVTQVDSNTFVKLLWRLIPVGSFVVLDDSGAGQIDAIVEGENLVNFTLNLTYNGTVIFNETRTTSGTINGNFNLTSALGLSQPFNFTNNPSPTFPKKIEATLTFFRDDTNTTFIHQKTYRITQETGFFDTLKNLPIESSSKGILWTIFTLLVAGAVTINFRSLLGGGIIATTLFGLGWQPLGWISAFPFAIGVVVMIFAFIKNR